jgi:hypothetical protein
MKSVTWRVGLAAAATVVLTGGPAQAGPVLEFGSSAQQIDAGDTTFGWSFTTTQAITVTALDAYDPAGYGTVRLYDGSLHTLASATLTTADAREGSPIPFYTQAITPVSLAANHTYYIVQDITAFVTFFNAYTDSPRTGSLIVYDGALSARGAGQTPTSDSEYHGALGNGVFGPNFDVASPTGVPEPVTLAPAVLAALAGAGIAWRKRRRSAV